MIFSLRIFAGKCKFPWSNKDLGVCGINNCTNAGTISHTYCTLITGLQDVADFERWIKEFCRPHFFCILHLLLLLTQLQTMNNIFCTQPLKSE